MEQHAAANVAATQRVFTAFGAGDIAAILALLDDDIVIDFYGPEVIPYARHYQRKAEAQRFFETVLSSVDIHEFNPEAFIADGETVVVTGHLHLTTRATGRDIESDFVHVITMRAGKWRRFRDFMNTAVAAAAFSVAAA